jgi:hypothetical protein
VSLAVAAAVAGGCVSLPVDGDGHGLGRNHSCQAGQCAALLAHSVPVQHCDKLPGSYKNKLLMCGEVLCTCGCRRCRAVVRTGCGRSYH